jgi:hypothetical protein
MRACVVCSLFALPLLAAAALAADPNNPVPEHKAAQGAIRALSENLDASDLGARAARIVKEHDSCDISSVFAMGPRGFGIGELKKAGHRDSIERLVQDYARKAPPRAELEQYQADLVRTAKMLQAMAELAPYRGPLVAAKKDLPAWAKVSAEFKVTTLEFRQAIEARDSDRVFKAAKNLNQSCCNCHALRQ